VYSSVKLSALSSSVVGQTRPRNLFILTLPCTYRSGLTGVHLAGSAGSVPYLTRFIAAGYGREYAAINSADRRLIPSNTESRRYSVNGTYWAGAILGTIGPTSSCTLRAQPAWRLGFLLDRYRLVIILSGRTCETPLAVITGAREARRSSTSSTRGRAAGRTAPVDQSDDGADAGRTSARGPAPGVFGLPTRRSTPRLDDHAVLPLQRISSLFAGFGKIYGVPRRQALYLIASRVTCCRCCGHFFDTIGRKKMIPGPHPVAAAGAERDLVQRRLLTPSPRR